jgi:hypothetical protein
MTLRDPHGYELDGIAEEEPHAVWLLEIPDPDAPGITLKLFVPADSQGDVCRESIRMIEDARNVARAQFDASPLADQPAVWRRIDREFTQKALDTHATFRYMALKAHGEAPVTH